MLDESVSYNEILEHGWALPAHSPKLSVAVSVAQIDSVVGRFFGANIFRFRWRELATRIVPECIEFH